MRIVFVENNDSFSWNVIERLPFSRSEIAILPGNEPVDLAGASALVIGPGPLDPARAGLLGLVHAAAALRLPTLGICLGHQAIGVAFGARLVRTAPVHGSTSAVTFTESRLFPGVFGAITAMRYHSLAIAEVASPLKVIAATDDGIVMAVEHESLPMAGVQFHPDSFATRRGAELVESFFRAVS